MVYKKGIAMRKFPENDSVLTESGSNRPLNVRMTLRDVLYVSYALPAGRMRNLIPDNLSLATAGDDMSFISIVALHSTQVRLNLLSFLRFKYYQLNIRTYVIDPVSGKNAVYFINSGVTSRFISLVTHISGIPWRFIDLETEVDTQKEKDSYVASGYWEGKFSLKAQVFSNDSNNTLFFENRKAAVDFLIRPLIGFVGDNRRLGRFTIQHPEVEPQSCILTGLDFPLFTGMGIVDELDKPHSVFFLPMADFSIYLPPTRIK
jgi:hypothetical protein